MSWAALLASLEQAGAIVAGPTGGRDDRELAEGYRHLTRIFSIATEMLVEKGDPDHPAFTRWMTPYRKMYGDNPGTIYDAAVISGSRSYVIRGRRGSHCYLGFCVYGSAADGAKRIVRNIDDDEMTFGPDGSFELVLEDLDADVSEVMVRQYFASPDETESTYRIECREVDGPPPPVTLAFVEERLAALGAYVRNTVEAETTLSALSASISQAVFRSGTTYVDAGGQPVDPPIDPSVIVRVMPTPAIQYSGQWFDDLGDDEVLIVEGTVPEGARYLSIQLLTRFMESGDWLHHPCFLTFTQGSFTVAIAHRDPGMGTWLDTTGLRSANVAVRALKAEGTLDVTFRRERLP